MRVALVTDSHAGVRGDSDTFADYQYKFWYDVFFPYLEQNNISDIIHLGDITDRRKWINYKTLHRFRSLINKMSSEYHLKVIIGNHDTYFKNTNDINSMNCLFGDSRFQWYSEAEEIFYPGMEHPFLFVPWINSENIERTLAAIENTTAKVCMGHLNLAGFEMARGLTNTEGMDHAIFNKFDMVMSGHFHKKSHMNNIWYLGSPFEQTWIDYNEQRGFHVFDIDTNDLEFVPNPHRMFFKIFYKGNDTNPNIDPSDYTNRAIKIIVNKIDDQYEFNRFIENMEAAAPWHMQILDNTDNVNMEDVEIEHIESKGTIELLNEYIEQTNYNNKEDVKSLMQELFEDAISV
jgi:predicted phosphodiesterase